MLPQWIANAEAAFRSCDEATIPKLPLKSCCSLQYKVHMLPFPCKVNLICPQGVPIWSYLVPSEHFIGSVCWGISLDPNSLVGCCFRTCSIRWQHHVTPLRRTVLDNLNSFRRIAMRSRHEPARMIGTFPGRHFSEASRGTVSTFHTYLKEREDISHQRHHRHHRRPPPPPHHHHHHHDDHHHHHDDHYHDHAGSKRPDPRSLQMFTCILAYQD